MVWERERVCRMVELVKFLGCFVGSCLGGGGEVIYEISCDGSVFKVAILEDFKRRRALVAMEF